MVFDWGLVGKSVPLLATGLLMTLKICALAIVFGTLLGGLLGLASLSRLKAARWVVMVGRLKPRASKCYARLAMSMPVPNMARAALGCWTRIILRLIRVVVMSFLHQIRLIPRTTAQ